MSKFIMWLKQHLPSIFYFILILIIILIILGKNTTMVMIPIAIILGIIQASMITNCDSDDYYARFIAFLVPLSFEVILFGSLHDVIKLNAVLIVSFLSGFALVFIIHLVRKHYMNVDNVHNADDNDDSYFTI